MHRYSQRGRREWAGGPSPPPCGQLTRCFSAVAELLVYSVVFAAVPKVILLGPGLTCSNSSEVGQLHRTKDM